MHTPRHRLTEPTPVAAHVATPCGPACPAPLPSPHLAHAPQVVAVDKSPFNVGVAKERYPSIRFYEMDAMDISGECAQAHKGWAGFRAD